MKDERMAGRPRTKHLKVKAIREQLKSLEDQILRLLPVQHNTDGISRYLQYTPCDEDLDRPFGDKGVAWRAAARGLRTARSYVTWLEVSINPDPPSDAIDDAEDDQGDADDSQAVSAPDAGENAPDEPATPESAPKPTVKESAPG
jgi:hypothetical protein